MSDDIRAARGARWPLPPLGEPLALLLPELLHDPEAALTAIKQAHAEPAPVPHCILYRHLKTPPFLGRQYATTPTIKRGRPPSSKTQYDASRDRWAPVIGRIKRRRHQLETLPKQGRTHAWKGQPEYDRVLVLVLTMVVGDKRIPASRRVTEVLKRLRWRNPDRRLPDRKIIKADLRRMEGRI